MKPFNHAGMWTRRNFLCTSMAVVGLGFVDLHRKLWGFAQENERLPEWIEFTGPETIDDDPKAFMDMLNAMGLAERVSLAQSLKMLPSINWRDYGSFGLKPYREYQDNERPTSYNDVDRQIVVRAIQAGAISPAEVSPDAIRAQLIYVSSSLLGYWWHSGKVKYHSLCTWVAEECGVPRDQIVGVSTFCLERRILGQMFVAAWDKLNQEQRRMLLEKIEEALGTKFENTSAIVALGGAAALATLGTTVAFSGFAFYTTMSVTICTIAGFFGVTLPFVVYTTASSTVALLAGPIGWIAAGLLATYGLSILWRANPLKTAAFITALHFLKAEAFERAGLLQQASCPLTESAQ
ncbi:MAG: hypothetical protein NZ899_13985 [Thermoguttaceae bacterium]|nr:hypothetical protein [Thermoguttaceae bacterium]